MANPASLLTSLSSEIASLAEATAPFVAGVAARPHRSSSGIAIGGNLILTADHAVERDRDIAVTVEGRKHDAVLISRDPATDLAVLRAEGLDGAAPPTAAAPQTGSLVLSVSRTGSGTLSTGVGVITSVGGPLRTGRGVVLQSIIRTDAALRPGTAGGALVDTQGRIVGITTPGLLRGLPVAIPASEAFELARRLAAHQPLGRGYLGVSVQPVALGVRQRESACDSRGLLVFDVASTGAAEQAGIFVGDILMRFDGEPLQSPGDLQDRLGRATPGHQSSVTLMRGGRLENVAVIVGERPQA
jgi:S1-C subfamily serine protease